MDSMKYAFYRGINSMHFIGSQIACILQGHANKFWYITFHWRGDAFIWSIPQWSYIHFFEYNWYKIVFEQQDFSKKILFIAFITSSIEFVGCKIISGVCLKRIYKLLLLKWELNWYMLFNLTFIINDNYILLHFHIRKNVFCASCTFLGSIILIMWSLTFRINFLKNLYQ